jgi:hypothetical protein
MQVSHEITIPITAYDKKLYCGPLHEAQVP